MLLAKMDGALLLLLISVLICTVMDTMTKQLSDAVIDGIGGTCAVASLCGITSSAVSQWRTNGIPKAQLNYLRLARPDVFARLETKEATHA